MRAHESTDRIQNGHDIGIFNLLVIISVVASAGVGVTVWMFSSFMTRQEYVHIDKRLDNLENKIDHLIKLKQGE